MNKLKENIKEEIKEEIGDIIYEKAKAEVKQQVQDRYHSLTGRLLAFFGIKGTKRQKIREVEKEIRKDTTPIASDAVLGIIELFTINYLTSVVELTTQVLASKPNDIQNNKNK